jgi:hypothetical protein
MRLTKAIIYIKLNIPKSVPLMRYMIITPTPFTNLMEMGRKPRLSSPMLSSEWHSTTTISTALSAGYYLR